jgi:hypothetical protein
VIKFQATNPENGRRILGIGMSHGNVKKLMEGKPIHFNAEDMGLPSIAVSEVLIYVGETEESMLADLEKNGYLEGTHIIEQQSERH